LYVLKQRISFLTGDAAPDFPQEKRECTYTNRATLNDLSMLGKFQLGFAGWELTGNETKEELDLLRECMNIIYSKHFE